MVNNSLQQFVQKNSVLVILIGLAVLYIVYTFMNQGYKPRFEMNNGEKQKKAYNNSSGSGSGTASAAPENILSPDNNNQFSSIQNNQTILPNNSASCNKGNSTTPSDLLPADNNSNWSQIAPRSNSGQPNLLNADALIGIDTIGQTLKNPNLQLRSEPPNPQINVGPWANSTITPDTYRRPLELGQGGQ